MSTRSAMRAASIGLPPNKIGGQPVPKELQEYLDRLRRAVRDSLTLEDFTAVYPFSAPHYDSGGRIELTQISNVTGGPSNVLGSFTKSIPHDEEDDSGDHHWAMRQMRPPSFSGLSYYASPALLPHFISEGPNFSGFRMNYDNLYPWSGYDAIANVFGYDTKICFQANVPYAAQATLAGGAVSRLDDELLGETTSLWQMSLSEMRDLFKDYIIGFFPSAYYQYVRDTGGTLLAQESVLGITAPLKAVDAAPDTTLKLAATALDKYLYSTGVDAWAEGAITAFGRSLVDDANASTARDTLGASSGIWPATLGGTGQSAYAVGDLLYASTTTALSKLAAGTATHVLTANGAGVAPSWQAIPAGLTGSGVANRLAYWSGASALTSDADLVFDGTNLLTTGLFVGALTGTPARALEVRSTSAQVRGSYDATNYWEISCDLNGNLSITGGGTASNGINIGRGSGTPGAASTILGTSANAAGASSVAIGRLASAAGGAAIAIGLSSSTGVNNGAICIGESASNTGANSVAIGRSATAAANQFVSGTATFFISNVFFGSGALDAAPVSYTLNGSGGSGTNIAGANLSLAGGKGTGNAVGGSVKIQTSTAVASGATLQTLATVAEFGVAKIGFYGVTPVVRPTAYTQTYATATRTHSNPTATALTAASGTADGTVQDVTAAFDQTILNNNFKDLAAAINALIVDVANVKQVLNSVIDDDQALGLMQ